MVIKDRQGRSAQEKHEHGPVRGLHALKQRMEGGYLKACDKIHQAIGRLKERYPRVLRYYKIDHDLERGCLAWRENAARKAVAEKLDGALSPVAHWHSVGTVFLPL